MTTKKLFVLDTNVLLHDPQSLFRFDEHDIYIPLITLEEMDAHKVGMTDVARNARQASRYIDELFSKEPDSLTSGIPLNLAGHKEARGKLILQTSVETASLPDSLLGEKADNLILGLVKYLQQQKNGYEHVALVSKDINIRIKARALGLHAEDYFNDKVLEDSDVLYTGYRQLDGEFWLRNGSELQSWQEQGSVFYRIQGDDALQMLPNELLLDEDGEKTLQARVREVNRADKVAILQTVKDYTHPKNSVFGITARNWGQNYALNLLMDPEIDLVTLLGQAGTGKTLLTLASALTQVLDQQRYSEIIMTRVTVPLGNDIGFLPGTEEEKMNPWMGALEDNLEVLTHSDDMGGDWARAATHDMVASKIKIKSINFMRGRTFQHKFLIIDEAQNLTSKQMKTMITRAGEGTKIVCMGNLAQIDTPYLSEGSSGLTYLVDRFKNWPHFGHITMQHGERSRLAAHAVAVL
ncbi:PhoH family protein [Vitreoscilla massiliensis]|uniref:PhoH family protein n=1 Tax=Vitreoscilla massiliensis TaxID=1689272 RepID=A0ABY4E2Y6_9NEIS|nr:PhoH family protein [Vitreoscilla massiliensis]UOO90136.1 PhoH family protein [Vitreoscilla massiliensis]